MYPAIQFQRRIRRKSIDDDEIYVKKHHQTSVSLVSQT